MNIVEYFVRLNLRRKISSRRESVHDINERLAEIGSQLETWQDKVTESGRRPDWLLKDLANWRAERSKILVRKARFERDVLDLERELTEEYRKTRSV